MRYVILALVLALSAQAEVFKVYTEQNPPFNYQENEQVSGSSTALLKRLFQKTGHHIESQKIWLLPWVQAYQSVLHVNNSVLYSAVRTPEREALFQWVGPIGKMALGVVAKKSRHIRIASALELQRYHVATIPGTASEKNMIALGLKEEALDRFGTVSSQVKKLAQGRVDAFAYNVDAMFSLLREMGYDPSDYEVIYMLKENDLYFAFNKQTDPHIITTLNETLKTLIHQH